MQHLVKAEQLETSRGEKFLAFYTSIYPFSNHYNDVNNPVQFTVGGLQFDCGEKFFFAAKAMVFGKEALAQEILATTAEGDPRALGARIVGLGKRLKAELNKEFGGKHPQMWSCVSLIAMAIANWAKYSQNDALRSALLSTGELPLVEANPYDATWGVGIAMRDPTIHNSYNWGQNLLGRLLVEICQQLRYQDTKDLEDLTKVIFSRWMDNSVRDVKIAEICLIKLLKGTVELAKEFMADTTSNPWEYLRRAFTNNNKQLLIELANNKEDSPSGMLAKSYTSKYLESEEVDGLLAAFNNMSSSNTTGKGEVAAETADVIMIDEEAEAIAAITQPEGIKREAEELEVRSETDEEIAEPLEQQEEATSAQDTYPLYMICQMQMNSAVGVRMDRKEWEKWPVYVTIPIGKADRKAPDFKYQLGDEWLVKKFTWSAKFRELDEREVGGGNFRKEHQRGRNYAVLHEETVGYQAEVKQEHTQLVKREVAHHVIGVVGARRGTTLDVHAIDVARTVRIEKWAVMDCDTSNLRPGDRVVLHLNRVPKGTWVGPRYIFPPRAKFHSAKDIMINPEEAVSGFVAIYARRYTQQEFNLAAMSMENRVVHDEQLMAANTAALISQLQAEERAFSFESQLRNTDGDVYELSTEGPRREEDRKKFIEGVLGHWRVGGETCIKRHQDARVITAGKILNTTVHEDHGRARFTAVIQLGASASDSIAKLSRDGARVHVYVPAQTARFDNILKFFQARQLSATAALHNKQGDIVCGLLGMKQHVLEPCGRDHTTYAARHLNERQLQAANQMACTHHESGLLLPIQAGYGVGKTRSILHTAIQLLKENEEAVITACCATNRQLIDLANRMIGALREEGMQHSVVLMLSKHALADHAGYIRDLGISEHICTLTQDEEGEVVAAKNTDVLERLEVVLPSITLTTPDKASMLPQALTRTTVLIADEVGKLPQAQALQLAGVMPALEKFMLAADKEQPTKMLDLGGSLVREKTGFVSILDLLMDPKWQVESIEYDTTYRGHPTVSNDLAMAIYGGRLKAGTEEADRQLFINSGINLPTPTYPVILIDNKVPERYMPFTNSCFNPAETEVALDIYRDLLRDKQEGRLPEPITIGFVCYYAAAAEHLLETASNRRLPLRKDDVHTVDGFIGGEWDIVFLITSKTGESTGHLLDPQRATAAWTRQRHGLIAFGNWRKCAERHKELRVDRMRLILDEFTKHTPIIGSPRLRSSTKECGISMLRGRVDRVGFDRVFHRHGVIPLADGYEYTFNRRWDQEQKILEFQSNNNQGSSSNNRQQSFQRAGESRKRFQPRELQPHQRRRY